MKLEETQTEKLYELLKLLEKHPGKLEDWTDDLRDDLVDVLANDIMNEGYDSAFSCEKVQTFAWYKGMPLNYDLKNVPRTQTIEPVYIETSAFFMFKRDVWKVHKQRIGFNPYFAVVDKIEAVDIDYPEDFEFAEEVVEILKRD